MQLAENLTFLELLLVSIHGISDVIRVPIDDFEFGHLLRFMVFLDFFLNFFFGEFIKLHNFFQELFVVELVTETFVVGESGIDSEDNGKFLFHGGPEEFEFLLRKAELYLIKLPENLIIFWNGAGAPLLMNFFMPVLVLVVFAC